KHLKALLFIWRERTGHGLGAYGAAGGKQKQNPNPADFRRIGQDAIHRVPILACSSSGDAAERELTQSTGCGWLGGFGDGLIGLRNKVDRFVAASGFEVHDEADVAAKHKGGEESHFAQGGKLARSGCSNDGFLVVYFGDGGG